MARAVRIILVIGASLLAAAALALALVLWTPAGPMTLKPIVADALGDALDSRATIGSLKGRLPAEIIVEDVRFLDARGEWLIVDRARLVWRPFALLRRSLAIDSLAIDGAMIAAPPPDDKPDEQIPRGFELPDRMPRVAIESLTLTNIRVSESLAGAPLRLDGAGSAKMGGKTLAVRFNATSSGARDVVAVRIIRDGDDIETQAQIASEADGAIALLSKLGGKVRFDATGKGPLADYALAIRSELGAYGRVNGTLSGNFERADRFAAAADAAFGERLDDLADILGPQASIKATFTPAENGGALAISQLSSTLGRITGSIAWRNKDRALAAVEVDAKAQFAPGWRPDLRRHLGDHLALKGGIAPKDDLYTATARIEASRLAADLADVTTDLQTFARGAVAGRLHPDHAAPVLLRNGAQAKGDVEIVFAKRIRGTGLIISTPEGGAFRGVADHDFRTDRFAVKGDVVAAPEVLAALGAPVAAKLPLSAAVDIKGAASGSSGSVLAVTPTLFLDEEPIPAARILLTFTDAPARAAGRIDAQARDGSRRFRAEFSRAADGHLRIRGLDYAGRDFKLTGSAAFDSAAAKIELDLAYQGGASAEPYPGLTLAGAMTAKGAIARGAAANALTIRGERASLAGVTLTDFSILAEGPGSALYLTAGASSLVVGGAHPITAVSAGLKARLDDPLTFILNRFEGDFGGAPIRLSAPATFGVTNGVSVERLRASIGTKGLLALDGKFERHRWRADLQISDTPVAGAASMIDATLKLDTSEATPASGAFTLTSLLTPTDAARLAGAFTWDGKFLHIRDDGAQPQLDLDLSLPFLLATRPEIEIKAEGEMRGVAHFEGRLETIAAFLPAALQSLEGNLSFDGRASGALAAPKLSGDLVIRNGAYTELTSGLSVVNIEAAARATGAADGSTVEFSAAGSGPGQTTQTIRATGALTISEMARLSATIALDGAKLSAGPIDSVLANGEIRVSGPIETLKAEGELTLRRLNAEVFTPESTGLVGINVVAVKNGAPAPLERAPSVRPLRLSYDIRIKGDRDLFVDGRGLTSEWRADLKLLGDAEAPLVLGDLSLIKGDIRFAGREFDLTRGTISFDRLFRNNPALDLRAERETQSGTSAAIVISGRAAAPKIALESTPSLPPEDIMALLLFDKPASELSALESLQVADSLAELGGIGPFGGRGLAGATRSALGLDVFGIDIDETDSAASTLTVGKYVADGLFVSATQDARGKSGSVRIEYEIGDSFTIETELRQDGGQTVSGNWKHDF